MVQDKLEIRRIAALSNFLDDMSGFDIVAIDIPIGLLDTYEAGGRPCDRAARKILGKRASSVFPAPIRPVLAATDWSDACARSRASAAHGKAISKQTFAILPKIIEVDELLRTRPELRDAVREVHPEACFCALTGAPMAHKKSSMLGREDRRDALRGVFPALDTIELSGKAQGLPTEDIMDATVACWSAHRLATGHGRSLSDVVPLDSTGLAMAIWV